MIRWTGLEPWEFEFPFQQAIVYAVLRSPGMPESAIISKFQVPCTTALRTLMKKVYEP